MTMTVSKYWNFIGLNSSGKLKEIEIVRAKHFIKQYYRFNLHNLSDRSIQRDLFLLRNDRDENSILADLCLRCFISHQIKQVCTQLYIQFGRERGFSRNDLFAYTLNDTLDLVENKPLATSQYRSLAVEILEKFDPSKASLSTWTTLCVRQNRELESCLLEHGVWLITNWAILNHTNNKQANRILTEFHNLTLTEVEQATILLSAYHDVYRRDRLKNGQSRGTKCQIPSTEQLERIAILVKQQTNLFLSPEQTLSQLERLANLLREYRIHMGGGKIRQESLDNTEINTERIQANLTSDEDNEDNVYRSGWLKSYRQQFQQSLDESIEAVITNRLNKFKNKTAKATQFTTALELLHCQGKSMNEIALEVGLKKQYQVTRLLKLKELRVDIRHYLLRLMRDWTMTQTQLEDINSLKQREQEIELALAEQIDLVLDKAEKKVRVANSTQSVLAKRICVYLDSMKE